jgi:hypothetical protein
MKTVQNKNLESLLTLDKLGSEILRALRLELDA